MRVFVTGASGFIGSAVVRELLDAGHTVTGLARSDASAEALTAAGAAVHRGSLDDLDSLRAGAEAADGVCHLAFIHDFSDFAANCATDLRAIETIGEALAGTDKPFVVTSGTPGLPDGKVATEEDQVDPGSFAATRQPSELAAVALAERGCGRLLCGCRGPCTGRGTKDSCLNSSPPHGRRGFRRTSVTGVRGGPPCTGLMRRGCIGGRWSPRRMGSQYHAVGDEGLSLRSIAEVIGRRLGVPTGSVPADQAVEHFGFLGLVASLDCPASSELTRKQTGWEPVEVGLLGDLEAAYYFGEL